MTRRPSILWLGAATMLAPFAVSVHVPVLPKIGLDLVGDEKGAAPTVSVFLWVFAAAMMLAGPASDRWGRRPVLLGGIVVYAAASLLAASAPSLLVLLLARGGQALGAAALVIVPRAMVRDAFEDTTTPMAQLATLQSMAPAVAPLVGGLLGAWLGWRSTFALLVLGAVALGLGSAHLPETRRGPASSSVEVSRPRWGLLTLMTVTGAAGSAVYFALLPTAAEILSVFGSGSQVVGVSLLVIATGFAGGAVFAPKLARAVGRLRGIAMSGAALLLGTLVAVAVPGALGVGIGFGIYAMATGSLLPLSVAEGLDAVPSRAGRAASILGAVQLGVGAAASSLVEVGFEFGTVAATAAAVTAVCAAAGLFATNRSG